MKQSIQKIVLAALLLLGLAFNSYSQVTLNNNGTGGDALGDSSFASGYPPILWSDGLAPHSNTNYTTLTNTLRTPPNGNTNIFGGASLTIPVGGNLNYKGTGSQLPIIITNLYLAGGTINNSVGGSFSLLGNIFLTANSTIAPGNSGGNRTINVVAPISGAYTLTNPVGTLILSGSNTFSGGIQVLSGATLQVGVSNALALPSGSTPAVVVQSGGSLDLGGWGNNGNPGIISTGLVQIAGSGSGTIAGAGALSTGSGGYMNLGYNYININNVSLTGNTTIGNNGGSGPTLSGGSDFMIGLTGLGLAGNGYTLTKQGNNVVYLMSSAQNAAGAVNINAGGLVLYDYSPYNGMNGLSNAPITLYSNAWFEVYGNGNTTFTMSNPFNVDVTGGQILNNIELYGSEPNLTVNGAINLSGPLTLQDALAVPAYYGQGTLTVNGSVSGTGSLICNATTNAITANVITLSSSNSYTGGTIVGGGTLKLGNTNSLGAPLSTIALAVVSNNAALDIHGNTPYATNAIVIQGTNSTNTLVGVLYSSAGWSYLGGGQDGVNYVTLAGDATIGNNSGNWFGIGYNGTSGISGNNHNLVKVGNCTVALMGPASSALASFTVGGGGILFYDQHNWLGTAATLIYSNGASSDSWNPGNWYGVTVPNNIIITNGGASINNTHGAYYGRADLDVYSGSVTLSAPLSLTCTATYNGSPYGQTYGSQTFNGAISGTNGITATIATGDSIVFNSTANYTGPTVVVGGAGKSGSLLLSTVQQGGGVYTNNDGGVLDFPLQSGGYVTVPMSVLALGSSTGAVVSLSRITSFSTTQAPITATNLTLTGTSIIQLPSVAYTISGQYPLIKYVSTNGTGGLVLSAPSVRGVNAYLSNNVANNSFDLVVNGNNAVTWTGNASAIWDITNSINWQTNGFSTFYYQPTNPPGDAVLFNDSSMVTNVNLSVGVSPLVITVNNTNNPYTFSGSPITNAAAIVKSGTGSLTVSNNNTFTGGTYINGGTLYLGNSGALNNSSGSVSVYGNGALDFNNQQPTTLNCTISGAGFNGLGTLVQNSGLNNDYGPGSVTLAGSATIGGNNRWDIRNGVNQLNSPSTAYTLTKVGNGLIALVSTTVSANLGNIYLLGGELGYQAGTTGLGNPTNTLTIGNGGTLEFYQTTTALNKFIVCSNGAGFYGENGSGSQNTVSGPVSVLSGAAVYFNNSSVLNFSSPISIASGTLFINGNTPSFTGGLTNITGTVNLGRALIGGSLTLPAGATLNCSNTPTFNGSVGLSGSGSVIFTGNALFNGTVNIPSGSTLQFNGNYYNTLTFSNVLSGSGNLGLQYQSVLKFAAANTYTGNLTLPNCNSGTGSSLIGGLGGHVDLIGSGSISQVPNITLQGIAAGQSAAAWMNVSGRSDGTLTLATNQTMQVDFGSEVYGNLTVGAGATLKMASASAYAIANNYPDEFFVANGGNLTFLPGSTNIVWVNGNATTPSNAVFYVNGNITYGGTLVVNTNGVTMQAGASFPIYNVGGSYSGSFSSIVPATPGPGLVWVTNSLNYGTLGVAYSANYLNANLTSLAVSNSTSALSLDNPFSSGLYVYNTTNGIGAGPVTLTVTNGDPSATSTLSLNGGAPVALTNGVTSVPLNLNLGSNNVSVLVLSGSGTVSNTYLVNVTQLGSTISSVSYLTSLLLSNSVTGLSYSPGFTTNTPVLTTYGVTNLLASNPVTVTVTNADGTATNTLTVNGLSPQLLTNGIPSTLLTLGVGVNNLTVQTVSADTTVTNSYTVNVTVFSTNANLTSLVLSNAAGPLTFNPPFNGGSSYLATNDCANTAVTVTVTNADPTATDWLITSTATNQIWSGTNSGSLTLPTGANSVTVQVVSQDLTVTNNYVVAVTVPTPVTVSVNSTNIYAGGSATLTATTSASSPTYLWSDSETTASITVSPSATTTYSVVVTDGTTGCTGGNSGTVTVLPSTNALLASLSISGSTLNPSFASGTKSYNQTNTYVSNPVTVAAGSVNAKATLSLNFNNTGYSTAVTNSLSVSGETLVLPTNTVAVQVVSQDLSQTNVYTVNVLLQPSLTVPHLTNSVSAGNLNLSWPADHLGYRLLTQTNNLNKGVSSNTNDWGTVVGSTLTTTTNLPIIKTGVTNEYYRLVYP